MFDFLIYAKTIFNVIHSENFKRQLLRLISQEPRLQELIQRGLEGELSKARLDIVPGLGGWAKCRLPSPSQRQGKRGGFRLIFLFFRTRKMIFLGDLYYKREQADIQPIHLAVLRTMAKKIKANEKEVE